MSNELDTDRLNQWLAAMPHGSPNHEKPLVILSYAASLDGSLALKQGQPAAISCDESSKAVHYLRSFCDAILVGIGTVLSDNPQLSVRFVPGDNPLPIIVDTDLRTPIEARLISGGRNPVIFCGSKASNTKKKQLETRGAEVLVAPENDRGLSFLFILKKLYDRGIKYLMVEGGPGILQSFLVEELWDKLAVTVAPALLGGYNLLSKNSLRKVIKFNDVKWLKAGIDQICLINREQL